MNVGDCFLCVGVSYSVVSNSLRSHGLKTARLLCPWNSLGKNARVGCHFLLQRDPPDPGMEPGSPALQADSLPSEPRGKPSCKFSEGSSPRDDFISIENLELMRV